MLLCYVITLVDCNETFETADGDPEEEYHSSDEEKYKSAWRSLKALKKQEYIQSLTPEQRQKYYDREAKWSEMKANDPRCAPS